MIVSKERKTKPDRGVDRLVHHIFGDIILLSRGRSHCIERIRVHRMSAITNLQIYLRKKSFSRKDNSVYTYNLQFSVLLLCFYYTVC